MSQKKIIHYNERFSLINPRKYATIALKAANNLYAFPEVPWTHGVIPSSFLDGFKFKTNIRAPGPNTDFSMTFSDNRSFQTKKANYLTGELEARKKDWFKRKIIHSIDVKLKNNIVEQYSDALGWSIVQVKKELFDQGELGAYIGKPNKPYFSSNQLFIDPEKNFFNEGKRFVDLAYNLPADEDFILIQRIQFVDEHFFYKYGLKLGEANHPYNEYDISIVYSDGYM